MKKDCCLKRYGLVSVSLAIFIILAAHLAYAMGEPPPPFPESTTTVAPETTSTVPPVTQAKPTVEATSVNSFEATIPSKEATVVSTIESNTIPTIESTTVPTIETITIDTIPAPTVETTPLISPIIVPTPEAQKPVEEGASYKDVPWGCDFNKFKGVKSYPGNLGIQSASLVNTFDDNDLALLLGAPVSDKNSKGDRRIMFEFIPQKFATAYYEPDDVYYIFFNGKFAMAFSNISAKNFDLYRDNFYKKYRKTGTFSKEYEPAAKKKYKQETIKFTKGKTIAFLIKSEISDKKNISTTAKLLFASDELFNTIRQEIKSKLIQENLNRNIKSRQEIERDLKKIE